MSDPCTHCGLGGDGEFETVAAHCPRCGIAYRWEDDCDHIANIEIERRERAEQTLARVRRACELWASEVLAHEPPEAHAAARFAREILAVIDEAK